MTLLLKCQSEIVERRERHTTHKVPPLLPPLQVAKLPFLINDGKWHHLCITWTTRDGMWEAFQDGVMRDSGENLAPYHPIKPEGVLVLGQEQVRCEASIN